ncbi:MAG: ABC transporter permease subunit [Chloroflexi bacterium]|nr:MAG: ABC transporter permease subunit [Chloroflexota bacterium]TMB74896.1 MAG: ABC transporter permease subunit [Chloroflexota bacterium]TMB95872.1 MAG: ABC transporter permease subunit [Chloroflexota bacterium]TMC28796.1 MAG: ABC transporter permease subunit [Chloroflexota bacterium]TMC35715.1 MAG: ABC transporter permease subunit [Chloroflexota bacterium]
MSAAILRVLRIPATISIVAVVLLAGVPYAMSLYGPYLVRPGIRCIRVGAAVPAGGPYPPGMCQDLAALYHRTFADLFVESMFRSLALLVGAAVLALVVGALLGLAAGLLRRRAWTAGAIVGATTVLSAVPAFFVAYFLQIAVIIIGATAEGGNLLPVVGFGYDSHLVLPLLAISVPAIAYTAQLTATRTAEVLEADFITAALARGLSSSWILRVHVLPHVRPVTLEALGSGLRVSVASLPIVEYLFQWRGIGQLALEAVGVHDAATLIFSALVLVTLFATLSAVADLSRPRALYRAT